MFFHNCNDFSSVYIRATIFTMIKNCHVHLCSERGPVSAYFNQGVTMTPCINGIPEGIGLVCKTNV